MRLPFGIWIFLYLVFAFGGEIIVFKILPPGPRRPILNLLPVVIFFAGLGLAFWLARQHHRKATHEGKPSGVYCANCGYDLRATQGTCPECGLQGTGKYIKSAEPKLALQQAIFRFVGITIIALLAAVAIMVHVQILSIPITGGH